MSLLGLELDAGALGNGGTMARLTGFQSSEEEGLCEFLRNFLMLTLNMNRSGTAGSRECAKSARFCCDTSQRMDHDQGLAGDEEGAYLPFGSRKRKDQSRKLLLRFPKQETAIPRRPVPERVWSAIAYRGAWQSAIFAQESLPERVYSPCTGPTIRDPVGSEATIVLIALGGQCCHIQRLCSLCLLWSPAVELRRAALGRMRRLRCAELKSVIRNLVL